MMDTRYQVKTDKPNKLIHISFDELDDTTINYPPAKEKEDDNATQHISNEEDTNCNDEDTLDISTIQQSIPDSVLQYERQMRKIRAADRASKTNVNPEDHLHITYQDDGKGLTEVQLNHLFDAFYTTTASQGGTGESCTIL